MLHEKFDPSALYNRVVHYYIDKKGYSKEKANVIAQKVVEREKTRKTCKNVNIQWTIISELRKHALS